MWFTNPDLNTLYLDIYKKRKKMSFYRQYRPGKFAFLTVRYQRTTRYYQITPNWFPSETSTSFVHFWRQLSPVHCPELSTAYDIPPIVENFIFRVRTISEFVHSGFLWVPDRNEFYSSRRQWKKKNLFLLTTRVQFGNFKFLSAWEVWFFIFWRGSPNFSKDLLWNSPKRNSERKTNASRSRSLVGFFRFGIFRTIFRLTGWNRCGY